MIERGHELPVARQAKLLKLSRAVSITSLGRYRRPIWR